MDLEYTCLDGGAQDVTVTPTLAEANEEVERGGYDVAILDISLPDGTTLDLAGRLEAARVPFIFHSGDAAHSVRREFADVPFFAKPAAPETMIAALQSAIGERGSKMRRMT